ncbi:hypothetical protein PVK06_047214 [Gossypium arboreum]|uniref:DUF4219 domain-containing protein n=1 Tax=Gossypium arboreum TaxID=29729 RepID=A0ABR0MD13_GOSAR|nr:hypothetical protein PVK06_047214 [Gossypium arboreum]
MNIRSHNFEGKIIRAGVRGHLLENLCRRISDLPSKVMIELIIQLIDVYKMSFTPPPPPVFTGENYHIWVVKMKTYLQAHDLWSVVENDAEPPPLRANPTIAQMRQHAEETAKKPKAMAYLQNGVSDVIFTRIMACDSPKQAWDSMESKEECWKLAIHATVMFLLSAYGLYACCMLQQHVVCCSCNLV